MITTDVLPDALASVLGKIVADARREWIKSADLIAAEARAQIAELRAENMQLRGQLQGIVDAEIGRLREAAAALKDGRDGVDGQPGEQGPPGPPTDYGIVIERAEPLIKNFIAARWDDFTKQLPLPERGEKGEPGERGEVGPAGHDADEQAIVERVLKALPPPERGEKGEPGAQGPPVDPEAVAEIVLRQLPPPERGEPGEPGKDADPEAIERLVAEKCSEIAPPLLVGLVADEVRHVVAELPPPERGERGEPGKDADPDVIERLVAERCSETFPQLFDLIPRAVADEVQRAVAELPPPERGEPGRDGASVDPDTVRQMVAEEVALLPPAERGEKGEPGKDADPELILKLVEGTVARSIPDPLPGPQGERGPPGQDSDTAEVVERVLALLPAPERGEKGEPGRDGQGVDVEMVEALLEALVTEKVAELPPPERGEKGDPGPEGPQGRDGVGIAGALIDRNNSLVLTLSDGTVRDLGTVVGKDGAPGSHGADGKDGLSFDAFELDPEYDGQRTLRLKWTDAKGKEQAREWQLPIVIDRGVYKAGETYAKGDAVSFGGSIWIAQADTTEKPGEGPTGWRLSVKSGRPGRDGKDGDRGERGAEGRPGRDWTREGYTSP